MLKVVNELKARGVNDILIAVVDGLKGFPEAITSVFPQTVVQTPIVHLIRNSLAFVSWKERKAILPAGAAAARGIRGRMGQALSSDRTDVTPGEGACRAALRLGTQHPQKMIYTTNAVEALHRSLRKIIKTRGSLRMTSCAGRRWICRSPARKHPRAKSSAKRSNLKTRWMICAISALQWGNHRLIGNF